MTIRLEDLDRICAALGCTVADLMEAEPDAYQARADSERQVVGGDDAPAGGRPTPRAGGRGAQRGLPPN
ncbi:hypothetical protein FDG2_5453 [Candidatus Protofrankia californiensis]|uniref:HTH cro/C1-type domain-containing protein n=1 Tax=Candidatus Protofrankia californiensis TaxID=1839754 RepID=A0A1C3PDE8_9ACTN|nr:hypothetical protein FDG2_5453 [Candidatus Protofrankia californiensis]